MATIMSVMDCVMVATAARTACGELDAKGATPEKRRNAEIFISIAALALTFMAGSGGGAAAADGASDAEGGAEASGGVGFADCSERVGIGLAVIVRVNEMVGVMELEAPVEIDAVLVRVSDGRTDCAREGETVTVPVLVYVGDALIVHEAVHEAEGAMDLLGGALGDGETDGSVTGISFHSHEPCAASSAFEESTERPTVTPIAVMAGWTSMPGIG